MICPQVAKFQTMYLLNMILSPTSGQLTTKFPHSALVNKKHKKFGRRPKARNIYADKKETNVKHLSLNSLL